MRGLLLCLVVGFLVGCGGGGSGDDDEVRCRDRGGAIPNIKTPPICE